MTHVAARRPARAQRARAAAAIRRGLKLLQENFVGTTLNGLMNVGLRIYGDQQVAALERDAQASLARIKRYRKTDPIFSKVFVAVARKEGTHGNDEPIEGVPFVEQSERPGPIVTAVRRLIHSPAAHVGRSRQAL